MAASPRPSWSAQVLQRILRAEIANGSRGKRRHTPRRTDPAGDLLNGQPTSAKRMDQPQQSQPPGRAEEAKARKQRMAIVLGLVMKAV